MECSDKPRLLAHLTHLSSTNFSSSLVYLSSPLNIQQGWTTLALRIQISKKRNSCSVLKLLFFTTYLNPMCMYIGVSFVIILRLTERSVVSLNL